MSKAYKSAIAELAPQARVVFDRFHVQRLAHDALDTVRREQVRALAGTDEASDVKKTRFALQKNPWNLTQSDHEKVSQVQTSNKPLYRGYLLKETLADILDRRQVNISRTKLLEWMAWGGALATCAVPEGCPHDQGAPRGHPCVRRDGPVQWTRRRHERQGPYDHATRLRFSRCLEPHRSHLPLLLGHRRPHPSSLSGSRLLTRSLGCQPELGAPAGGALCPSPAHTRGRRAQRRASERPQPPGAARSGVLREPEHGEDGEDATLPVASTSASWLARWADASHAANPLKGPESPT